MADRTPTSPSAPPPASTFPPGTLMHAMHMELVAEGAESTVVRMPVEGNRQAFGRLHGGAGAALAETAASIAATHHARTVHPGEEAVGVGVDLNITHHRAALTGTLTATATPLHAGRKIATYEILTVDEEGRLVSTARLTAIVLPEDRRAPRA